MNFFNLINFPCKGLKFFLILTALTGSLPYSSFAQEDLEETKNVCVAQSISNELLSILIASAQKVLQDMPPDVSENIVEVKEKVSRISEDLFKFIGENQKKMKLLEALIGNQTLFGDMMRQVFNSIINNEITLSQIKETATKEFQSIKEILESANFGGKDCGVEPLPFIEPIINQVNHSCSCNDSESSPGFEQILDKQNEAIEMIRKLQNGHEFRNGTEGIVSSDQEIRRLREENEELRKQVERTKKSIRPKDCADLLLAGETKSGVYQIYPNSCECGKSMKVWCDMESEGGGWTVVVSRMKNPRQLNFTRPWKDYEDGFGHPEAEYWIGNSNLHLLTSNRQYSLRLDAEEVSGVDLWGLWRNFAVGSSEQKYLLTINDYLLTSTIGNVFKAHNGEYFSTYDSDNDSSYDENCAQHLKGGWWYAKCYEIHPTGIYNATDINQGISTSLLRGRRPRVIPLQRLSLKIKPKLCVSDSTVTYPIQMSCNFQ